MSLIRGILVLIGMAGLSACLQPASLKSGSSKLTSEAHSGAKSDLSVRVSAGGSVDVQKREGV
ncbi:hypothetical protein EBZ37_05000, partial [bacterium]|nr:hypothetical protein [bacterium]